MSEDPTQKKDKHDDYYDNAIKLLVNKFFSELDNNSSLGQMHEGLERKFEVWADGIISDDSIKEDVFHQVMKEVSKKNGKHKTDN